MTPRGEDSDSDDDGEAVNPTPADAFELCSCETMRIKRGGRGGGSSGSSGSGAGAPGGRGQGVRRPHVMLQKAAGSMCAAFDTRAAKLDFYKVLCQISHIDARISAIEIPTTEGAFPFFVRCSELPADIQPLQFGEKVATVVARQAGSSRTRHTVAATSGRTVELVFPDLLVTADQAATVVMHLSAELPADDPPALQKEYRWHDLLSPRCYAAPASGRGPAAYQYVPETAAFEVCGTCSNRQRAGCETCGSTGHVFSEERTRRLLAIVSASESTGGGTVTFGPARRPTFEELMLTSVTRASDEPEPDTAELESVQGMPFVPGASSSSGKSKPTGRLWGKNKAFTPVPDGIVLIFQGIIRRQHPMWSRQIVTKQGIRKLARSWLISQRGMNVHFFPACRSVHPQAYASLRVCSDGSYAPCPVCGITPQKQPLTNGERTALFPDANFTPATDFDDSITLEDRVITSARAKRDRAIKKKRSVFGFPKPAGVK